MGDATFQDLARLMGLVTRRVIEMEDEVAKLRAARMPGPLLWTATPPTEPGWYWVKRPNLPPEISEFPADEIEHWQDWYWEGSVWAGPIPEPEAAAGGTG